MNRLNAVERRPDAPHDLASELTLNLMNPKWPIRVARARRQRVFILGSHVTRDALLDGVDQFEVVNHVGRASLVSMFWARPAPAEAIVQIAEHSTPSRQRNLLNDLCKTTVTSLTTAAFDWLVIDLIDERFPLIPMGPSLVTCTGDLMACGIERDESKLLAVENEARMRLWEMAVEVLFEHVPAEKIVVNRVYWAGRNVDGTVVVSAEVVDRQNRLLARMYDHLERRGAGNVIEYPDEFRLADPLHPWGSSPFHLSPAFYRHTLEQLARKTG